MSKLLLPFLFLMASDVTTSSPPSAPIVFIINSQSGNFHSEIADKTRSSLMEQWKRVVPPSLMKHPRILLTAEMDPEVNKIRDLFKVKLYTIRSETKKREKRE